MGSRGVSVQAFLSLCLIMKKFVCGGSEPVSPLAQMGAKSILKGAAAPMGGQAWEQRPHSERCRQCQAAHSLQFQCGYKPPPAFGVSGVVHSPTPRVQGSDFQSGMSQTLKAKCK